MNGHPYVLKIARPAGYCNLGSTSIVEHLLRERKLLTKVRDLDGISYLVGEYFDKNDNLLAILKNYVRGKDLWFTNMVESPKAFIGLTETVYGLLRRNL